MRKILAPSVVLLTALAFVACDETTVNQTLPTEPGGVLAGFTHSVDGSRVDVDTDPDVTGAVSFTWGDGSGSSAGRTASHEYADPGEYTITQTVESDGEVGRASVTVRIADPGSLPVARFSWTSTGDLCVQFVSLAEEAERHSWSFGDGNNSVQTDPEHCYASAGTWSVVLTVSNAAGSDTVTERVTSEP